MSLSEKNLPAEALTAIPALHKHVDVLMYTDINSEQYKKAYLDVVKDLTTLMQFHPNWNPTSQTVNYDILDYDVDLNDNPELPLGWVAPKVADIDLSLVEELVEDLFVAIGYLSNPMGSLFRYFETLTEKTYDLSSFHPDYNVYKGDFSGAVEF